MPNDTDFPASGRHTHASRAAANDNGAEAPAPVPTPRPCAICSKPATPKYKPFCSKHCADVDLGRWLHGTYAIPVASDDDDEDGIGEPGREDRSPQ